MKRYFLCVGILLVLVAPAVLSAPPTMTPGLWEITLQNELPEPMPPMTTTVCVSKDDIADRQKPPKVKSTDECPAVSGDMTGNVLSYVSKCKSRDLETKVRYTFHGDRYDGVVEMKSAGREMRQVITGRRIGDCEEVTHASTF
jgi:hypothetical protein